MQDFFKIIKEYWVIFVFLGSLGGTWVQFDSRIGSLEVSVGNLESASLETSRSMTGVKTDIAEIKTSLNFIREYLVGRR